MAKASRGQQLAQRGVKQIQNYQGVFSGVAGTEVLYDLMATHGMLRSTFKGDVNEMLIKEGERNVVLRILTILKTNPNDLIRRMEEHSAQNME